MPVSKSGLYRQEMSAAAALDFMYLETRLSIDTFRLILARTGTNRFASPIGLAIHEKPL